MKRKVIVIGGGMAGLAAALELLKRDCDVTLLEASDRCGGRIHTVRCGTLPVELGAEFVHGRNPALLEAIRDAGLLTHKVPEQNFLAGNGRISPVALLEKVAQVMERADPRQPDRSFSDFLNGQSLDKQTRQLALAFIQGFHAGHPERIGLHSLLRADYSAEQMDGEKNFRIEESYGALITSLENEICSRAGIIKTNTAVRSVDWWPGEVTVHAHGPDSITRFTANAAVVTLPLGVLKARTVEFTPPLADKQEAIDGLAVGNVVKIGLVFREAWWPQRNSGIIHALEEKIPTWWDDPRGPILTGWAGGPKADLLVRHSPRQLETLALETLARVFSTGGGTLRQNLVASYTYNWARDRNFRGAYSYIPVNGLHLPRLLAAPIRDTLFFAGEATAFDAQTGMVFSAWQSGLRAATEVLESEGFSQDRPSREPAGKSC